MREFENGFRMIESHPQTQDAPNAHLLTVVLEDYFQVAPLNSVVETDRWYRFESRVEANTGKALDLLDEFGIKATFFVLGWVADEMPELIHEVVRRGHEVASKGYVHRRIRGLDKEEFRDDLLRSREALERAGGCKVEGYRIAHGWFAPEDLWALDVLAQEGFSYDSSIRPLYRNFAHEPMRRFAHLHRCGEDSLWEFPLSTASIGSWSFPIAGGNYLRQLPHWLMKRAVAGWERRYQAPFVMYFHVWELDPDQPRISAAPLLERVRQYRNLDKMAGIIRYYLGRYSFIGIGEHLGLAGAPKASAPLVSPGAVQSARARVSTLRVGPDEGVAKREPVTVVIPCFNEELILPYLANTLKSVEASLAARYELEFVFVDDASTDGTWAALQELWGDRRGSTLVRHDENFGVAAAILTGIHRAETETVCSIDCDCTYDPHQLENLIPLLREGVDMVTASPYHREGEVRNVPAWRIALSKRLSGLYRLVLRQRLATYTSCFRVYRRSAMLDLELREGGFLGVAEMLGVLDLDGRRIVECPANLEVRLLGQSKMRVLKTGAGHLRLLARLIARRLKQGWHSAEGPRTKTVGERTRDYG
jgi:polysaccharide deacetylase family protein (PEP-CTERM system associated)